MGICIRSDGFSFNRLCKMVSWAVIVLATVLCISLLLVGRSHLTLAAHSGDTLRIVIDTDAGTDDAVAILALLSDPYFGRFVEGITCVRGNTVVDKVSINVLKVLEIANRTEVPVYVGAAKGYIESPDAGYYFGLDGMGDANYPEMPSLDLLQKKPAAEFLAKIVNQYPGEVTVLSLAPMTNVALATRLNPNFMVQLKNIYGMIGSIKGYGNMRPGVEFNAFMDPHAASVSMQELSNAGRKMTIIPTDTIRENFIGMKWRRMKLGALQTKIVDFMNRIERKQLEESGVYWDTYDVYAAVALMREDAILEIKSYYADFEIQGQISKGIFVVDFNNVLNKTPNVDIILQFDKGIVKSVCLDNFS